MRRSRRSPLSKKAKAEAKGNPKQSNGRGRRRKAKPAQREPEYFQEKRNLETEAKKRKLHRKIQKKLKLRAEVKFLRRKYNSFLRNLPQETPIQLKKLPNKMPLPTVRIAQSHNATNNSDIPLQNRNKKAKKAESQRTPPLFDLNKVSLPNAEEMEEGIQAEWEPLKVAHDLNASIYKDVGNGSSHVGKRKISWQDQILLRVSIFVKACKDQIDILKNRIYDKEKIGNSNRWLPILDDSSLADVIAHKHGMVAIREETMMRRFLRGVLMNRKVYEHELEFAVASLGQKTEI